MHESRANVPRAAWRGTIRFAATLATVVLLVTATVPGQAHADQTVAEITGVGSSANPSIAVAANGDLVVAYVDSNTELAVIRCTDGTCLTPPTVQVPDPGVLVAAPSVAIGAGGFPVVAYYDLLSEDLRIARCGVADCASATVTVPDSTGDVGQSPSLVLDLSGNPAVAYLDDTNQEIKLLRCSIPGCQTGNSIEVVDAGFGAPSLALDSNDLPAIAHFNSLGVGLQIVRCSTMTCAGPTSVTSPLPSLFEGERPSLVLSAADTPIVVAEEGGFGDPLLVVHCDDATCSTNNSIETIDLSEGSTQGPERPSVVLNNIGNPVVAFLYNFAGNSGDLGVLTCGNPKCASGNVYTFITLDDRQGGTPSIALDSLGNPVIAHETSFPATIDVVHCDIPTCHGPSCDGHEPTIDLYLTGGDGHGTALPDVISGTRLDDVITSIGGDDVVCGREGDDTIYGASGDDVILGGKGHDMLFGGSGGDQIEGGHGRDTIEGQGGPDKLVGGPGGDTIDGQGAADILLGDGGDDIMTGQNGADTFDGGPGDDRILGNTGPDFIEGGPGDDDMLGGAGADSLKGDDGFDLCSGNTGPDRAHAASCEDLRSIATLF